MDDFLWVFGFMLVIGLLAEYPGITIAVAIILIVAFIALTQNAKNSDDNDREEFKKTESLSKIMEVFCDLSHIQEGFMGSISFHFDEKSSWMLMMRIEMYDKDDELEWLMDLITRNSYRTFSNNWWVERADDHNRLNEALFGPIYSPKAGCFQKIVDYLEKNGGEFDDTYMIETFSVVSENDRKGKSKMVMLTAILQEVHSRYPNLSCRGIEDSIGRVVFGVNPPLDD